MNRLAWWSLLGLGCVMCLTGCALGLGTRDIAPADSLDVDWLQSQVDWRSVIRISVEGAKYQLARPRVTPQGLEYGNARAVDAMEAEVERLPQTVELGDIDGIEIRESGERFCYALLGAALGLAAAVMILPRMSSSDAAGEPYGAMATFVGVGAVIGIAVGGTRYKWKPIYERDARTDREAGGSNWP